MSQHLRESDRNDLKRKRQQAQEEKIFLPSKSLELDKECSEVSF
jgi:hypothetical protein